MRKVVAIIAVISIALAATGLAVELDRGAPRDVALEPVDHRLELEARVEMTPAQEPPSCFLDCQPASFKLDAELRGLPSAAFVTALLDGVPVAFQQVDDVLVLDHPAQTTMPERLRIDMLGRSAFDVRLMAGVTGATVAGALIPGEPDLTVEQIGTFAFATLVDVSAPVLPVVDLRLLVDGHEVATLEGGAWSGRLDGLRLDGQRVTFAAAAEDARLALWTGTL